jgi:hypothetical protein
MKSILLGVLTPILLLLSVDSVSACWCRREVVDTETKFRAEVSEAVKQSNAVFVGEIIAKQITIAS